MSTFSQGHLCPPGTALPLPCPSGTFSNNTGAYNLSVCAPCPSGRYCHSAGTTIPQGSRPHHHFRVLSSHLDAIYRGGLGLKERKKRKQNLFSSFQFEKRVQIWRSKKYFEDKDDMKERHLENKVEVLQIMLTWSMWKCWELSQGVQKSSRVLPSAEISWFLLVNLVRHTGSLLVNVGNSAYPQPVFLILKLQLDFALILFDKFLFNVAFF